ncbi:uncharacterized protein TNCV_297411 [Trichonephila clavipes]|nr:uncharacterized protein TNCV_297411 [Trichonephila clavipes]
MDPSTQYPGKGLVLPNLNIYDIAKHSRFLILSLPNNEIPGKTRIIIHKALIGIGGEPKSIKKLRSGDLLIETASALQSKSFLLAKTFLDSPLTVSPHRALNSCRGIISELDLLCVSETEILEGLLTKMLPRDTSSVTVTSSTESQPPIPLMDTAPTTSNSLSTSAASSSSNQLLSPSTSPMSTVKNTSVSEPTTSTFNSLPSIITSPVPQTQTLVKK